LHQVDPFRHREERLREAIHAARAMDCRASLAMTATPQERLAMTDATTAAQCDAITLLA